MAHYFYSGVITEKSTQLLAHLIPAPEPSGRPPLHDRRELVNAMAYWLRAGCAWRLLPHDPPPWQTVYHYFRSWRQQGLWGTGSTACCMSWSGFTQGRARPSCTSQSIKTAERGPPRL